MTMAAGFICADGIVVAADSEYTNPSSGGKWSNLKIFEYKRANYGVVITGAGDATLIRMAADHIDRALKEGDDLSDIWLTVEAVTSNIAAKCIFPDPTRPDLFLIVATRMNDGRKLLLTSDASKVAKVDNFVFVGIGETLGRTLASWLHSTDLATDVTSKIALHITYWVKKHVDGCGQETHVISLKESRRRSLTLYEDSFFWGLNELLQPILIGCLDSKIKDEVFAERLQSFQRNMQAVRDDTKKSQNFEDFVLPIPPAPPA
ncbi:MAG: hypothetical protein ACLQKH_03865 [Steroidobacteraceae bacterium]